MALEPGQVESGWTVAVAVIILVLANLLVWLPNENVLTCLKKKKTTLVLTNRAVAIPRSQRPQTIMCFELLDANDLVSVNTSPTPTPTKLRQLCAQLAIKVVALRILSPGDPPQGGSAAQRSAAQRMALNPAHPPPRPPAPQFHNGMISALPLALYRFFGFVVFVVITVMLNQTGEPSLVSAMVSNCYALTVNARGSQQRHRQQQPWCAQGL
jgi:hypothetical protein